MNKDEPSDRSTQSQRGARGAYRSGTETRGRILDSAVLAFGFRGFQGASAREIASDAGVKLPAIAYHFGSKEGLYRACAEQVVSAHNTATADASRAVLKALSVNPSPVVARTLLADLLKSFGNFYMATERAPAYYTFLQRELADPGLSYDILFGQLWKPGLDLVTEMIELLWRPRSDPIAARADAILLVGGVMSFALGWRTALQLMATEAEKRDVGHYLNQVIEKAVFRLSP